jgi:hypothetical protein
MRRQVRYEDLMEQRQVSVVDLLRNARQAIGTGALMLSATDIEEALQLADSEEVDKVLEEARTILSGVPDFFDRAAAEAEKRLEYAIHIMSHPSNLEPEEWLLLISLVSQGYVLESCATRFGARINTRLDEAFEQLRELSNDFRHKHFVSQLRHARSNAYTPLPSLV